MLTLAGWWRGKYGPLWLHVAESLHNNLVCAHYCPAYLCPNLHWRMPLWLCLIPPPPRPWRDLNSLLYFNIHWKKNVIFCFPSNCQFCGMNWQLCTPIFLAALLESLLNKLGENSETWSVWASFTWRSEPSKRPPSLSVSEPCSHHCSPTGFLLRCVHTIARRQDFFWDVMPATAILKQFVSPLFCQAQVHF